MILGIAIVCIPLLAIVLWIIPDTTLEDDLASEAETRVASIETEQVQEQKDVEVLQQDRPSEIPELHKGFATPAPKGVV